MEESGSGGNNHSSMEIGGVVLSSNHQHQSEASSESDSNSSDDEGNEEPRIVRTQSVDHNTAVSRMNGDGINSQPLKSPTKTRKRVSDYPVDCNICLKTFQSRRSLVRHFRRFHQGQQFVLTKPHIPQQEDQIVESTRKFKAASAVSPRIGESLVPIINNPNGLQQAPKDKVHAQQNQTRTSSTGAALSKPDIVCSRTKSCHVDGTQLRLVKLGELCETALAEICASDGLDVGPNDVVVFTKVQLKHLGSTIDPST